MKSYCGTVKSLEFLRYKLALSIPIDNHLSTRRSKRLIEFDLYECNQMLQVSSIHISYYYLVIYLFFLSSHIISYTIQDMNARLLSDRVQIYSWDLNQKLKLMVEVPIIDLYSINDRSRWAQHKPTQEKSMTTYKPNGVPS